MGGRGRCLESAVDVSWDRVSLFSTLVLVLLLIWFPWETFFYLVGLMEPQHSAFTGAPQDHRIFYSLWTNYRLLDVLPHQITEFSSHHGEMSDFCMCCLRRSPSFFSQYRYINIQHLPEPHRITEFSTHCGQITDSWMCCLTRSPNFLLIVEKCQTFVCVASPDHRVFSQYRYINIQHLPEPHRITEFFFVVRNAGQRAVLLARWIVRSVPLEIDGSSGHEKVPTRGKPGLERPGKPLGKRIEGLVDPTVTRSTIRADVGVAIAPQTIFRHLAEGNLKSKRPFRALPLTPEHRQLRLQWCQARSM
ncbi:transposable element Tcb2 transposase [Trichonephila clavipes]|nr:transposable element Tcb2 transposase [Trichonephila clavipes]